MTITIEVNTTKEIAEALLAELVGYAIEVAGAEVTGGGVG